jgi:predicted NAD/FAD-binding protein
MKIAIVGTGISGLVAAYLLADEHELTVFESGNYVGGHTHTLDVSIGGQQYSIDTGFIVYNERNYPNFKRLLRILGVETQPSNMSFSVRCEDTGLEYSSTSINSLFAQRRNILRPGFWRMILGIRRFYREATELLESNDSNITLGEYLRQRDYPKEFLDWHLGPMGSAIWSTGCAKIQEFPAKLFVQFFKNHGFLQVSDRPPWRVIKGGSRSYVEAITENFRGRIRLNCPVHSVKRTGGAVEVTTEENTETFDKVVIATHSDQALSLLSDATTLEKQILGAIQYQPNETVLHTDESLLPRRKRARASWNYHLAMNSSTPDLPSVTYYMNMLQSIESQTDFCVTLNRSKAIDRSRVLARLVYDHPVYTAETLSAQRRRVEINGMNHTYFCGAYWGNGFHEDGVNSALEVTKHFGKGLK